MRHINPIVRQYYWSGKKYIHQIFEPVVKLYTYEKASPNRKYIKVIQFIADHPKCKRFDVQCSVWNIDRNKITAREARGYMSTVFSNLLYDDLIDYDKNYCYTVTSKGTKLLAEVNSNIKE